LGTTG